MRPSGVRLLGLALCVPLLTSCMGHGRALTEHEQVFQRVCGNHSCPAPGISRPTFTITVDGKAHLAPESLAGNRPHRVQVTITPEAGSTITRFWVAETRLGACCGVTASGPEEGHVLTEGNVATASTPVSFDWTPTIPGQRMLMLGFCSTAPVKAYETDGYAGIPLGRFTVSRR